MSVRVMSWAWSESHAEGTELLVLLALADAANDAGYCWPGLETVAAKARVSVSTAYRAIVALADRGEVEVIRRGNRQSNAYVIGQFDRSGFERSVTSDVPDRSTVTDPKEPSLNRHTSVLEVTTEGQPRRSATAGCRLHTDQPSPKCSACITLTTRPVPASDDKRAEAMSAIRAGLRRSSGGPSGKPERERGQVAAEGGHANGPPTGR